MPNPVITTSGLILKEMDYRENDTLITILTKDLGVVFARARGAKRSRSHIAAPTGLFAYSNLTLYRSKDKFTLDSADSIDLFFGLHSDILKLSLAAYICELCSIFSPELEPAEQHLRLALNTLHLLEKDKRPPLLLKAIFELRLTAISGFMPDLSACAVCMEKIEGNMLFSPGEGTLICPECASGARRRDDIPLCAAAVAAMRHVVNSPADKVFNFTLSGDAQRQFCGVCERNLLYYAERPPASLNFLTSVLAGID